MFNFILKKVMPIPRMDSFDSYMFVGPHPDDIEVGAGGAVATLVSQGKKVTFVIVTDGSVGSIDSTIPEQQLVQLRQAEAIQSAKVLGVEDVRFLGFADGGVYDMNEMTRAIAREIVDINPQVVVCTDHRVPSECHPDHINVGRATTDAYFATQWQRLNERMGIAGVADTQALAYYYTDKPNSYVAVGKTFATKLRAIQCHKTQFDDAGLNSIKMYFTLRNMRYGLKSGKGKAEAFRILNNTQMHYMPEISSW